MNETEESHITFSVDDNNLKEIVKLCHNGDIYVKGKLIENDKELVAGMREWLALATRKTSDAGILVPYQYAHLACKEVAECLADLALKLESVKLDRGVIGSLSAELMLDQLKSILGDKNEKSS